MEHNDLQLQHLSWIFSQCQFMSQEVRRLLVLSELYMHEQMDIHL